jgi:hypothetical protein
MPIRKFRSVEAMNQPVWRSPGDPDLYAAIRGVWDFGTRTARGRFRPGVFRYRSVDEMNQRRADIRAERTSDN